MSETKFHAHTETGKNIVVYILTFIFLAADERTKGSGLNVYYISVNTTLFPAGGVAV
jgi:hypothetical protein